MENAISLEIKASAFYVDMAHQLWLDLDQRHAQQNAPRTFEIKPSIINLLQSQDPVRVYWTKLNNLVDELINYELMPNCTCGGLKTVIEYQDRDYIMKFLIGLDESYKGMIGQILMMRPLPSMNEVFSIIQ